VGRATVRWQRHNDNGVDNGVVDAETLLAAAARALHPVLGPVSLVAGAELSGSDRSRVVRALVHTGSEDLEVVVKTPTGSGLATAREEAALRVAARLRLPGPVRLLASSVDPPLLVLADAGRHPTLADRLLGADAGAAEDALLRWAGTLGALQAASAGCKEDFERELAALSPFGAPPADSTPDDLADGAAALARNLPRLDVTPPAAALDELRSVCDDLVTATSGLAPGDTCPDNAIDAPDGVVLLDFEAASHRHAAWEGAYLTVPWPSCWCSWRLPAEVAARALARWGEALGPVAAEPDFAGDLARTTVAWAVLSTAWLLPAALDGDPPPRNPAALGRTPPRRAMIQHRLGVAAALPTPVLPALRALADQVHAGTLRAWGSCELDLAPAFR
jgi:hypothetical protein